MNGTSPAASQADVKMDIDNDESDDDQIDFEDANDDNQEKLIAFSYYSQDINEIKVEIAFEENEQNECSSHSIGM